VASEGIPFYMEIEMEGRSQAQLICTSCTANMAFFNEIAAEGDTTITFHGMELQNTKKVKQDVKIKRVKGFPNGINL
jgi:hypothetical protein